MTYNGIKQIVIDKTNNQVIRWGYCDFSNDNTLDGYNEEVIEKDFEFSPDIDKQDWFWNDSGQTFYTTGTYKNRHKNFLVQEVNKYDLVTREIWYHDDNGDGTYDGKVKEIVYVYSGRKLIQTITRMFYPSGRKMKEATTSYYTNADKRIVKT